MCALREPDGDMAELECMHHCLSSYYFRIHLISLLLLLLFIVVINIIYNSIF